MLISRATGPFGNNLPSIPITPLSRSHSKAIVAVCIVCLVIAWSTALLRLWTRAVIMRLLGLEDLFMGTAILFFTVFNVTSIMVVVAVGDKSVIPPALMTKSTTLILIAESTYILSMVSVKLSLGLFFLRIMTSKWQRIAIYLILAFATTIGIAYFLFAIFECGFPLDSVLYWQRFVLDQCIGPKPILGMAYMNTIVSAATDLALLILPIGLVVRSKLKSSEKRIVVLIFLIATASFGASCARLHFLPALARSNYNWFSSIELIAIWSSLEPGLGITAASLAAMRPLLRAFLRHLKERKAAQPTRSMRWLFTRFVSSSRRTESTDNIYATTVDIKMNESKSATSRSFKPLNTAEAPDFLEITNSDDNYTHYDPDSSFRSNA